VTGHNQITDSKEVVPTGLGHMVKYAYCKEGISVLHSFIYGWIFLAKSSKRLGGFSI
jgi:hypothetical protein